MLSVIFSLYIRYTTILAYCTDIRVISLIHVYAVPRRGSNPGPLDCKSEALPTELCGPLSIIMFKNIYELNNVFNDIILMIISLSVTLNKVNYQTTSDKQKKGPDDDHLSIICEIK